MKIAMLHYLLLLFTYIFMLEDFILLFSKKIKIKIKYLYKATATESNFSTKSHNFCQLITQSRFVVKITHISFETESKVEHIVLLDIAIVFMTEAHYPPVLTLVKSPLFLQYRLCQST